MRVTDDDDLMIITRNGKIIRLESGEIRATAVGTQGVRLVNLGEDDVIAAAAWCAANRRDRRGNRRRARAQPPGQQTLPIQ